MKRHLYLTASIYCLAAATASAAEQQVAAVEEIIVYGQGLSRQSQTITANQIALQAPGTSAIKLLDQLPSVNFQSADPFGAYEWAVRISVRGFNQNQMGFTLDSIPLGDMTYGNHNGLHISRAAISDNLAAVELAQGSGMLGAASSSNLGGSVRFQTRDPDTEFGGTVAMMGGSEQSFRPFVRLDTGSIGTNGPRAFVSATHSTTGKWKGDGKQRYNQVNAKIVQPIGDGALSAYYNHSDRAEQDYQDLSKDMIGRLGYGWDNFFPDYNKALTVARIYQAGGSNFPAPVRTVDDSYFDAAGLRRDDLGYVKAELPVTEFFSVEATGYMHTNKGQGIWITPYLASPNGAPLSLRTTEYDIDRKGLVASATAEINNHELSAGIWVEDNDFNQARRFYQMGVTRPDTSVLNFQTNPFFTQWEYAFNTKTTQLHIQDTMRPMDNLVVNFGVKSLSVRNRGAAVIGSIGSGTIEAEDNFLPQVGLTYDFTPENQLFASYAENMRAFIASGTSGPFSTTQAAFDVIRTKLKPEKSRTIEAGWRFNTESVQGVLAVYRVKFDNRLLSVSQGPGIVGAPSALSNVGSVTSQGVELGSTWDITPEWSLVGSYAYNDSKFDDDTVDGAGNRVATKGKTTTDAPKHLMKSSINYDSGSFFGQFGMSFVDRRYYTYTNDASVPDHTVFDLMLGYRWVDGPGVLAGTEIQANVTNLLDRRYVSTIGSNGFSNTDPNGTSQTLLAGAPQQFFITLRKTF